MVVDRKTAEKISAITSEHFYNILLKKKKFYRVVHPDSVRNVMENKKIFFGEFEKINDLNKIDILEKLSKIANELEVESLTIGVIKKCETDIVYKNIRSTERRDFWEYHKTMDYSYKFVLEVGIFSVSDKKIVWIGEGSASKSGSTPELEQNILVAVATNGLEKFFRKYLIGKILREEPEYQCILKIVNTLPF